MGRLDDKVIFITGAARGQGRAHAVTFAREGAKIIGIDVDAPIEHVDYPVATAEDMAETVRQVEAAGGEMHAEVADVRSLEQLTSAVNAGVERFGKLTGVVANAGVDVLNLWNDFTPDTVRTVIDINLLGVWNTVVASVDHLIANGGGSIGITSSANGLKAGPFNVAYNMSKYGVVGLAKSFAMELAPHKIRVNTVHPGAVDTPMAAAAMGKFEKFQETAPELMGMFTQWLPGSMPPEEISNVYVYLLSDESTWVTGSTYQVDGGLASY